MCKRVFGPGLDSRCPTRSWRSASHAAGLHDWFPPKNRGLGLRLELFFITFTCMICV